MNFETVIGLEIHVELKTNSKIFSSSPNITLRAEAKHKYNSNRTLVIQVFYQY